VTVQVDEAPVPVGVQSVAEKVPLAFDDQCTVPPGVVGDTLEVSVTVTVQDAAEPTSNEALQSTEVEVRRNTDRTVPPPLLVVWRASPP
jgi:hypothetical protein